MMTKTLLYWGRWPNKRHLHSTRPHLPAVGDIISVNMASCLRRFTYKQPLPQKGSSVSFVCLSFPGYCTYSVRVGHMTVTRWITSRWNSRGKKTHFERKQMHQMSRNQRDPVWTNQVLPKGQMRSHSAAGLLWMETGACRRGPALLSITDVILESKS